MRSRIRHIRRNSSSTAPTYHVCLTVYSKEIPSRSHDGCGSLVLAAWEASRYEHVRGRLKLLEQITTNPVFDFWQWLYAGLRKRRKTWVWVYRAAEAMALLGLADQLDSIPGLHHWNVWESKPFLQSCKHPNGNFLILDIRNWCNHEEKELIAKTGTQQWLSRVIETILRLRSEADLGYLRCTVAAQAYGVYRHRLCETYQITEVETLRSQQAQETDLTRCYPVPHADSEALELEQRAYFGGVFRQYFRGRVDGPIHIVDIRSAYAAAMVRTPMPARLLGRKLSPSIADARKLLNDYCCIAWCLLESNDYEYATREERHGTASYNSDPSECWTKRSGELGKTTTGIGRIATAIAGPELAIALERGDVRAIERLYYYEPRNLFGRYVAELWRLRQEAVAAKDPVREMLCKDLLASLWGKFGQSSPTWMDDDSIRCPVCWGLFIGTSREDGWTGVCRAIAGKAQRRSVWRIADGSSPAVAAYVASNARVMLYELISAAGKGNVYYAAVDCVHVNDAGYANINRKYGVELNNPGDVRLQRTIHWAYYHSPSAWWTEGERSISGIPQDAEQITDTKYRVRIAEPAAQQIYDGPHSNVKSNTVEIDIGNWSPRSPVGADGWVHSKVLTQW